MLFDNIKWLAGDCFYSPDPFDSDNGGTEEQPGFNPGVPIHDATSDELHLIYGESVNEPEVTQYLATVRPPVIYLGSDKAQTISFAKDWFRLVATSDKSVVAYESNKGWSMTEKKQAAGSSSSADIKYVKFVVNAKDLTATCDTKIEELVGESRPIVGLLQMDGGNMISTQAYPGRGRYYVFNFMNNIPKQPLTENGTPYIGLTAIQVELYSEGLLITFAYGDIAAESYSSDHIPFDSNDGLLEPDQPLPGPTDNPVVDPGSQEANPGK